MGSSHFLACNKHLYHSKSGTNRQWMGHPNWVTKECFESGGGGGKPPGLVQHLRDRNRRAITTCRPGAGSGTQRRLLNTADPSRGCREIVPLSDCCSFLTALPHHYLNLCCSVIHLSFLVLIPIPQIAPKNRASMLSVQCSTPNLVRPQHTVGAQ